MSKDLDAYKYNRKVIFEAYFSRYVAGCFLVNDVITIADTILRDENFLDLPQDAQMHIQDMIEGQKKGDACIVISDIGVSPMDPENRYQPSTITIAYSQGGGLYMNPITLPGSLGKHFTRVDFGPNRTNDIPQNALVDADAKTTSEVIDPAKMDKEYKAGVAPQYQQQA